MAPTRVTQHKKNWLHAKEDELDEQWKVFMDGKLSTQHSNEQEAQLIRDLADKRDDDTLGQDRSSLAGEDIVDEMRETGDGSLRETVVDEIRSEDNSVIIIDAELETSSSNDLDMFKMFQLFKALEKRKWNSLIKHIKAIPQSASVQMSRGSKGLSLALVGNLLLHEVCRTDPPVDVISVLLKANRGAAKIKGQKGYLPLHYACASGASSEVVKRLLDAYPAAGKIRDGADLMLPVHLACKWGPAEGVLDVLLQRHPASRQVRDIYAKSPMDYAKNLGSQEERDAAIACLLQEVEGSEEKPVYDGRAVLFKDKDKPIRDELTIARSKMGALASELSEREHKFALLFGQEQKKVQNLEQDKEQLLHKTESAKTLQEVQIQKIELLETEHNMLKALQQTHMQTRVVLEKKVEALELAHAVKQDLIERLQHENNFKYKQELTRSLQEQSKKYNSLLQGETDRVIHLETRAKEVAITHRLYTKALLEEHDREAEQFEELTLRFKDLEGRLRKELQDERNKNQSFHTELKEDETKYNDLIQAEQEKVTFLEEHVTKVNELLETEQKRFQELETILQEALSIETEQREEMAEDWDDKQKEFESFLTAEKKKVETLQEDYAEVRELLKKELEKVSAMEEHEAYLKSMLDEGNKKVPELQNAQEESQKLLEAKRQMLSELLISEAQARDELRAEQEKVQQLEQNQSEMKEFIDTEQHSVSDLRRALQAKQTDYDSEKKKVKALQKSQVSKRLVLESLQTKVVFLEAQLVERETPSEEDQTNLNTSKRERDEVEAFLQTEKEKVERLMQTQQKLRELLEAEKERVMILEQAQTIAEAEIHHEPGYSADLSESFEATLVQNRRKLNVERLRVSTLADEQDELTKHVETEESKVRSLEKTLEEKEEILAFEREQFKNLQAIHSETQSLLEAEHEKFEALEKEYQQSQLLLESEQREMSKLLQSLEDVKAVVESKEIELSSLEEAEREGSQPSVDGTSDLEELVESNQALRDAVEMQKGKVAEVEATRAIKSLLLEEEKNAVDELERELEEHDTLFTSKSTEVHDLEQKLLTCEAELHLERGVVETLEFELSESRSLYNAEKRKATELADINSQMSADLKAERVRSTTLEQTTARKQVLLESEQNKVKSLEHAHDQLQALLDWEKKNVQKYMDSQLKMEKKLEDADTEISDSKKALDEKKDTVESLSEKLSSFEEMKKEVVRLSAEARRRDLMLGSMLAAIGKGKDKDLTGKAPVQKARIHVSDLHRIIGLDLAGLEDDSLVSERGGALVVASPMRRFGRKLCWTIPLIPLVAYGHDPNLLKDLAQNLDATNMMKDFAAQIATIDPSVLQETINQMFGMATGRMS